LFISHLLAKAIPVRGAILREARLRKLKRAFCFYAFLTTTGIYQINVRDFPEPFPMILSIDMLSWSDLGLSGFDDGVTPQVS